MGREVGYSGAQLQTCVNEEKAEIRQIEKEQREREEKDKEREREEKEREREREREREEKEREREERRLKREAEEQERQAQLQLAKINAEIEISRANKSTTKTRHTNFYQKYQKWRLSQNEKETPWTPSYFVSKCWLNLTIGQMTQNFWPCRIF